MVVGGGRRMAHKLQPSHEKNAATRKVDGSMTRTWHDAEPDKTTEAKWQHSINEKPVAGFAELTHSAGRSLTELRNHCNVAAGRLEKPLPDCQPTQSFKHEIRSCTRISSPIARPGRFCPVSQPAYRGLSGTCCLSGWPEGNANGRQRGQKRTRQQTPPGAQGRTF